MRAQFRFVYRARNAFPMVLPRRGGPRAPLALAISWQGRSNRYSREQAETKHSKKTVSEGCLRLRLARGGDDGATTGPPPPRMRDHAICNRGLRRITLAASTRATPAPCLKHKRNGL